MVAASDEEMDGSAASREPGGGGPFELRRRKVVECAKETLENGEYVSRCVLPCLTCVCRLFLQPPASSRRKSRALVTCWRRAASGCGGSQPPTATW